MPRPQREPARRMAYPSADTYTPGDTGTAPSQPIEASPSPVAHETLPSQGQQEDPLSRTKSPSSMPEGEKTSSGLTSWWKSNENKIERNKVGSGRAALRTTTTMTSRGVFGSELSLVLKLAPMHISTSAPDGSLFIWGTVPIVIGRCGAYLKHQTNVEGIFRKAGLERRLKELQLVFDSGPKYGLDLDWTKTDYTPHDVASIFKRFLKEMPEPVIPFRWYQRFREVPMDDENIPDSQKVRAFKDLILEMPSQNQHLLLYVLDLLGIFAKNADVTRMDTGNLATIFQPSLLHHKDHDQMPTEAPISTVDFLIKHQNDFVFSISKRIARDQQRQQGDPGSSRTTLTTMGGSTSALPGTGTFAEGATSPRQATPVRPPPVRATPSFMLASDSDDAPPEDGWFIMEQAPVSRTTSPRSPQSSTAALQSLIPPPLRRNTSRTRATPQFRRDQGVPASMELSDSDDDFPVGSLVVIENNPKAANFRRQGSILRSRSAADNQAPRPTGESVTGRPRTTTLQSNQSGETRRTTSREEPPVTGLARRRTLPTGRISDLKARIKRGPKET